jgi:3-isopropylmalate dehydratase small subunit
VGVAGHGFRLALAPSLGDLLFSNRTKIALLPMRLDETEARRAMDAGHTTIDLGMRQVRVGEEVMSFEFDPPTRVRQLQGADDVTPTPCKRDLIERFESRTRCPVSSAR